MVFAGMRNVLRSPRFWLGAGAVIVLLALLGAGWGWWRFRQEIHAPFPSSGSSETYFVVSHGQSGASIARRLEDQGLIRSAFWFRLYLRLQGDEYQLKAGEYRLEPPLSLAQVAETLHQGSVHQYRVTVPEGLDRWQIAEVWARAGFGAHAQFMELFDSPELIQELDSEAGNLEGYLFPDTYLLPRHTSPRAITRLMLDRFLSIWTETRRQRALELGFSLRDVMTLASLIEKETGLAEERALVSAVFHNRLRRNMKLECDPTVIYAVKLIKPLDGIIHRSDLMLDSPYNTYLYPGLPPGPISNAGVAAVDAALDPAPVDDIYFVARRDGSHHFSSTYRDHQRAVFDYRGRGK